MNHNNALSSNYDFSIAISKCQSRLERLKGQQSVLNNKKYQLCNYIDYRNFIWPLRKPVSPNPLLYAYQFIPPKFPLPQKPPMMTTPVNLPSVRRGIRMRQQRPPSHIKYGFNGDDINMFIEGMNNIDNL